MKSFKQIMLFLLAGFILPATFVGCTTKENTSVEKFLLKVNFPEKSKYIFSSKQTQNISSMGIANIKQTIVSEYLYESISDSGKPAQLAVIFRHLSFKSSSPAGDLNYDSNDADDTTSLFKNMGGVIGMVYIVDFDSKGKIKEVQEKNPSQPIVSDDDLEKIMSDSTFSIAIWNMFDIYPGKPVGVGEKWHSKSESNVANFKIQTNSTYTLTSIENGLATISVSSVLNLPQSSLNTDGSILKIQMEGTQTGTITMRLDTGEVVKDEMKQKVNAKINSMGQELPMIIESETKGVSKRI